jgi:hypothetical protein
MYKNTEHFQKELTNTSHQDFHFVYRRYKMVKIINCAVKCTVHIYVIICSINFHFFMPVRYKVDDSHCRHFCSFCITKMFF